MTEAEGKHLSADSVKDTARIELISEQEFFGKFRKAEDIQHKIIPAEYIIRAIKWAQREKQLTGKAVAAEIKIRDSFITGDIHSRELEPGPLQTFSQEIYNHYRQFSVKELYEIPCLVVITGTEFQGMVDFGQSIFHDWVVFTGSTFSRYANFSFSYFNRGAAFPVVTFKNNASFTGVNFQGEADFGSATFLGLMEFNSATFSDKVDFDGRLISSIQFIGANFFKEAILRFNCLSECDGQVIIHSAIFKERATFWGLKCSSIELSSTIFHDFADFRYATITEVADFRGVTFKDDVDFYACKFPIPDQSLTSKESGLNFDETRFEKTARLKWNQLVVDKPWWQADEFKIITIGPATWISLEEVFRQSGNLHAQNEAMYQRKLAEKFYVGENVMANMLSEAFWGFGIRPIRLCFWILAFNFFFIYIIWQETIPLGINKTKWDGAYARLRFSVNFALNNSWKLDYGYNRSLIPLFKGLSIVHSVISKVMLLCLFYTLSQISPLLNDLVRKLVGI